MDNPIFKKLSFLPNVGKSSNTTRQALLGSRVILMALGFVASAHIVAEQTEDQQPVSQRQALQNVQELHVEGPVDVILRQGAEEYVKVTGLPMQLEKMHTTIHDEQLRVVVPRNPKITDLVVLEIQLQEWEKVDLEKKVQRVEWDEIRSDNLVFSVAGVSEVNGKALMVKELEIDIAGRAHVDIQTIDSDEVNFGAAGSGRVKVDTITASKSVELELSGSGKVMVQNIRSSELDLELAGSGEMRLGGIVSESADLEIAGSGQIEITDASEVNTVDLELAGSARALVKPLQANTVDISMAGSGEAEVTALQSLDISVAGSGDVRYWGEPTSIDKSVMGSASIRQMGQSK